MHNLACCQYAAGRPLKLRELRSETGRDGMTIGSVLTTLQRSALVVKPPPPLGKGLRGGLLVDR